MDAIENVVFSFTNAILNTEKVDLLFYHQNTPGYTIAAIDNLEADIAIEAQTSNGDLNNFSTQNQTRFKTYSGNPNFDGIRSVTELENAYSGATSSTGLSRVTNLTTNDIFGVQLASSRGGRIGIIRVIETLGTTTR